MIARRSPRRSVHTALLAPGVLVLFLSLAPAHADASVVVAQLGGPVVLAERLRVMQGATEVNLMPYSNLFSRAAASGVPRSEFSTFAVLGRLAAESGAHAVVTGALEQSGRTVQRGPKVLAPGGAALRTRQLLLAQGEPSGDQAALLSVDIGAAFVSREFLRQEPPASPLLAALPPPVGIAVPEQLPAAPQLSTREAPTERVPPEPTDTSVLDPLKARPSPRRPGAAGHPEALYAARLRGKLALDGHLGDAAWQAAPPFHDLIQLFPEEGQRPSQRTDVKVLFDEHTLFVGVRCYDTSPSEVVRPLARRDNGLDGDLVQVYVDSGLTRRTAALFVLTAAGVQGDAWVYDDDRLDYNWDAVWNGAVALLDDGWSAEFAIPLSVLSYPKADRQTWGFGVQRIVGRTHERSSTMFLLRGERGLASRLGVLNGIEGIAPLADFSASPYVTTRAALRPQYSDPAHPQPRILEPSVDVGADLSTRLGPRLRLHAALNPDFGQVESDEVILNTSNYEYQFPEKRPFFYEGMDLFNPVGSGEEQQPHQLFYSRRIGLSAPILGAVKLVGQASDDVQIGVFDAVVAGTGQGPMANEDAPDRSLRWTGSQPLRLAPGLAYPLQAPAKQNLAAAVVRMKPSEPLTFSAQATSALPLGETCTLADLSLPAPPPRCTALGGNALALSFETSTANKDWYAYGQASASKLTGGPPLRVLPDGIRLTRADDGFGGYIRAGKRGGEPVRFDLRWSYSTPKLELNPLGFQAAQNLQELGGTFTFARPNGSALLHQYSFAVKLWSQWTTDQRRLGGDQGATVSFDGLLKLIYLNVRCEALIARPRFDAREVRVAWGASQGTGIPLEMPTLTQERCTFTSDPARPFTLVLTPTIGRSFVAPPLRSEWSYSAGATLSWRPAANLETKLDALLDVTTYPVRYVDGDGGSRALVFGRLRAPALSLVLRQMLMLTPQLTLQAYAQFFSARTEYGPFFGVASSSAGPIRLADLRPIEPSADPGFAWFQNPGLHESRLVINANLRWEYAPGSSLWLVYRRDQAEQPLASGEPVPATFQPRALAKGPSVDTVLVKWVHLFRPGS